MTEQEEHYLHFVSSIDKLNSAWRILGTIRHHTNHPLAGPAFQFALVGYSKPYTVSYGAELDSRGRPKRKYLIDEKHIPGSHRALHERLLIARNKIHAHDDLSVKEAQLFVINTKHGKIATAAQNKISETEELSNIDAIIDLIELHLKVNPKKGKAPPTQRWRRGLNGAL